MNFTALSLAALLRQRNRFLVPPNLITPLSYSLLSKMLTPPAKISLNTIVKSLFPHTCATAQEQALATPLAWLLELPYKRQVLGVHKKPVLIANRLDISLKNVLTPALVSPLNLCPCLPLPQPLHAPHNPLPMLPARATLEKRMPLQNRCSRAPSSTTGTGKLPTGTASGPPHIGPRAQGSIPPPQDPPPNFCPPSVSASMSQAYGEGQKPAQDWTSVPPPTQY